MADLTAPTTLPEFDAQFPNEDACRDYLAALRWPDGFVCPVCSSRNGWWITSRPTVIQCSKGHQTSITAGTVMHASRQPLRTWFYAAFLMSTLTPGISAVQFQKQLGLTRYETAFQMLHKLRAALVDPDRDPLSGNIEVDEAFIGGAEEGRPGRGAETKVLVIVAVEVVTWLAPDPKNPNDPDSAIEKRRAGRIRAAVIPDASAETLLPWIEKNIAKGATISTDGWASYGGLSKLGYTHQRVLQSHKGQKTGVYLPLVHLIISNLKRWLLGTHKGAVLPKHLPAYLNEFVFRFNRRFWRGPAFLRVLGLALDANDWPEYESLYAVGKEGGWVHPNPRNGVVDEAMIEAVIQGIQDQADPRLQLWMAGRDVELREVVRERFRALGAEVR